MWVRSILLFPQPPMHVKGMGPWISPNHMHFDGLVTSMAPSPTHSQGVDGSQTPVVPTRHGACMDDLLDDYTRVRTSHARALPAQQRPLPPLHPERRRAHQT